jgi:hypothetical protein
VKKNTANPIMTPSFLENVGESKTREVSEGKQQVNAWNDSSSPVEFSPAVNARSFMDPCASFF